MMKKLFLSIMILFALSVLGQNSNSTDINWTKMGDNKTSTFYEVQSAFQSHWENKKITKGCGYKPFKRWEAFMTPRVYPTGNMILPYTNYANFYRLAKTIRNN